MVAAGDLDPILRGTLLWREEVERVSIHDPEGTVSMAARLHPTLVLLDIPDPLRAAILIRELRNGRETKAAATVVLCRGGAADSEGRLRVAGADLILAHPGVPQAWDRGLQDLLGVPARQEGRVPTRLTVWIGDAASGEVLGQALNLGPRGLLLETTRALEPGSRLDLCLELPSAEPAVPLSGRILRAAGVLEGRRRFGVEFHCPSPAQDHIAAFVDASEQAWVAGSSEGRGAEEELNEALRESEARKAAILESASDCIVTVDEDGRILEFNRAAEHAFGHGRQAVLGSLAVDTLVPSPRRSDIQRRFREFVMTGDPALLGQRFEASFLRADGGQFPAEVYVRASYAKDRLLVTAYIRDVTARRRAEMVQAAQHEATRVLAESSTVVEASSRLLGVLGHGLWWDLGNVWVVDQGPDRLRRIEAWSRVPTPVEPGSGEVFRMRRLDLRSRVWETGQALWQEVGAGPPDDVPGWERVRGAVAFPILLGYEVLGVVELGSYHARMCEPDLLPRLALLGTQVGQFLERRRAEETLVRLNQDLDRRVADLGRTEAALQRMARFDSLTGLPNRTFFLEALDQNLYRARRRRSRVALIFVDLDGFKGVNDNLGHDAGDDLLRLTAERLRRAIRKSDMVARMGGDEFTVVVQDLERGHDAAMVAQKALEEVVQPCVLNGREILITASVGISVYPDDGEDPQTLLRNADLAMYRAKAEGKNTYRFFTPAMSDRAQERLVMEASLRRALERSEFQLHYQPLLDRKGRPLGAEALIRWRHPERGLVSPARFIAAAEENGLILPIGEWVLRTACAFACSLGRPDLRVAVNLSARQFSQPDTVQMIEDVLRSSGLDPRRLELEVTESAVMSEIEEVILRLDRLRGLGVQLALDDFGTGFSSLSYLKRFRFHRIKVDGTFVRDLPHDGDSVAIVSAIIAMAHGLGLEVVAEGVETEAQLAFLRERGCDAFQGYLFSPVLSPSEIERYLAPTPKGP